MENVNSQPEINLEDAFQGLFKTSVSGTGEEELLRIASRYSLQITAPQIRCLIYLLDLSYTYENTYPITAKRLKSFVDKWLELKQHNNSDMFVMKALEYISLRKFLNENSMKINIDK